MLVGRDENTIEMVGHNYPFFRHVTGVRDGLDLQYKPFGALQAFKPVLENLSFQVNEFSLSNYTMMRDRGIEWMTAIPVFLNRAFRHGSLYVRRGSDLTHPSDLRGKTIGAREYTQTAGVWWRGTMIDEYDLHWTDLNWVTGPKQRFVPPDEASVRTVEGNLEQMVVDGKIDAFLAPFTEDSKKAEDERQLRPLIPNTEIAERDYFARTGIYPLNHAVVIHETCLVKHPAAAKALFDACCASKKQFYADGGNLNPWGDQGGDAGGDDFIPFGLTEKNREIVATLWRYLLEQKLISRIPDMDPLFADGAAGFVDD
jgi:4,5-dihydroxyphthalate decarboxylase